MGWSRLVSFRGIFGRGIRGYWETAEPGNLHWVSGKVSSYCRSCGVSGGRDEGGESIVRGKRDEAFRSARQRGWRGSAGRECGAAWGAMVDGPGGAGAGVRSDAVVQCFTGRWGAAVGDGMEADAWGRWSADGAGRTGGEFWVGWGRRAALPFVCAWVGSAEGRVGGAYLLCGGGGASVGSVHDWLSGVGWRGVGGSVRAGVCGRGRLGAGKRV